jgi:hypothetical protein
VFAIDADTALEVAKGSTRSELRLQLEGLVQRAIVSQHVVRVHGLVTARVPAHLLEVDSRSVTSSSAIDSTNSRTSSHASGVSGSVGSSSCASVASEATAEEDEHATLRQCTGVLMERMAGSFDEFWGGNITVILTRLLWQLSGCAGGLDAMHGQGVAHGDIAERNQAITAHIASPQADGKVLDFGTATFRQGLCAVDVDPGDGGARDPSGSRPASACQLSSGRLVPVCYRRVLSAHARPAV